jgi:hypothetical protein
MPATDRTHRADLVRESGPLIASSRLGGLLGQFRFTGPLLRVSVYPAGLLVEPLFQRAYAILATEILDVTTRPVFPSRQVVIRHSAVDIASPLVLFGRRGLRLLPAIEQLTGPATGQIGRSTRAPVDPGAGAMTGLALMGIVVSLVMAVIGLIIVIPTAGAFGIAWTGVALVAGLVNVRRLLEERVNDS